MTELKKMIDNAARAKSQGIQFNRPTSVEASIQAPLTPPKKIANKKSRLIYIAGGLAVLLALLIYSSVTLYKHLKDNSTVDAQALVAEVGKLVSLPEGEIPTIATVTDPSVLSGQAFFKEAQVGDRVLIYSKARKAILYRGSEHRVVGIAPLTF